MVYLEITIGQFDRIFTTTTTTATATATTAATPSFTAQSFVDDGSQLSESLFDDGIGGSSALKVNRWVFVCSKDL